MANSFTITGEAFTTIVRNLVLDGDHDRAFRMFCDGLDGDNIETVACKVLRGDAKLTGKKSWELVDDIDENYRQEISVLYAGRYRWRDGRWFRPAKVIVDFGQEDAYHATKLLGSGPSVAVDHARAIKWSNVRAMFYADSPDWMLFDEVREHGMPVLWMPCDAPPAWLDQSMSPKKAYEDYIEKRGPLPEDGHTRVFGCESSKRSVSKSLNHPEVQHVDLVALRDKIREQSAGDFLSWTLPDGRKIEVPRKPFECWTLRRTVLRSLMPDWTCVSPCGVKMGYDDPYHTDWVLGAGLDLREAYDERISAFSFEQMSIVQERVGSFESAVVVDNGDVFGKVGEDVIVLPDLSPNHLDKIDNARAIITQAGGTMAHLAQVAGENGVTIMRVADAVSRYRNGMHVTLKPSEGKITIAPLDIECPT